MCRWCCRFSKTLPRKGTLHTLLSPEGAEQLNSLPPNLLGVPVLILTRYKEKNSGIRALHVINVKRVVLTDALIKIDAPSWVHWLTNIYNYGPLHTKPETFKNSTINTSHFGFVFGQNSSKRSSFIIVVLSLSKSSVFQMSSFHTTESKAGVFKLLSPPWRSFSKSSV